MPKYIHNAEALAELIPGCTIRLNGDVYQVEPPHPMDEEGEPFLAKNQEWEGLGRVPMHPHWARDEWFPLEVLWEPSSPLTIREAWAIEFGPDGLPLQRPDSGATRVASGTDL